jgi:hypothetical protein
MNHAIWQGLLVTDVVLVPPNAKRGLQIMMAIRHMRQLTAGGGQGLKKQGRAEKKGGGVQMLQLQPQDARLTKKKRRGRNGLRI